MRARFAILIFALGELGTSARPSLTLIGGWNEFERNMLEQLRWTLALTFGAGLLPGVVFGLWILAVIRAKLTVRAEARRDSPLTELETDLVRLRVQRRGLEAALGFQVERSQRLEVDLTQLLQKHGQLQDNFARERERVSRTVGDLKRIREAWLNERRQVK